MKQPDSLLVDRALNGDRKAFRQIVENTQQMVFQVAYRFLRDQHEAEDAVQEVYVKLWKNLKHYKAPARISTWLYRIVSNHCLDILKSPGHRLKYDAAEHDFPGNTAQSSDTPLIRQEASDLVLQTAAGLSPVQKAVFILRDLEGLTSDEVCQALSMSPYTLKSNLYHARKRMAELLKPFKNELI